MNQEIFRFSIVRNPQKYSSEQLRYSTIDLVPEGFDQLPTFNMLVKLRQDGASREELVTEATKALESKLFLNNFKDLNTPFQVILDWLLEQKTLESSGIKEAILTFFGVSVKELITLDVFKRDKIRIIDSLVVATIISPRIPGLRGQLIMGRRMLHILEELASNEKSLDKKTIKKLLNATILLSASLFPLPSNNQNRIDQNTDAYKEREKKISEEEIRIQKIVDTIDVNTRSIDELTQTYSHHLFEKRHLPREERSKKNSLSILPKDKLGTLSETTQNRILNDLMISDEAVEVPYIVQKLEFENEKLGKKLNEGVYDLTMVPGRYFQITCGECQTFEISSPKSENNFTPDTRGKVESYDMQDLLIVRQKLLTYKAGEIAHIENILEGEKKSKKHRKLNRVEETLFEEFERVEEVENELQTTDKFELQTESSQTIKEDTSVEAGVTVTASYGTVNVEAHGNYASQSSTEESKNSASTYAKDVVSRSLQKIHEKVLNRRSRTDISEVEIINKHKIDNPVGSGHIRGVYRWVDKFYEAQIVNYGKRTMLEFMVPEPAAFYKFAQHEKPKLDSNIKRPEKPGFCVNGVFNALKPTDLKPENYMCFVGKYQVSDVTPPPPKYKKVTDILYHKLDNTEEEVVAFAEENESFKIPKGYVPITVDYSISGGNTHSRVTISDNDHDDVILVLVTIGNEKVFRYFKNEVGKVKDNGDKDYWENIGQTIEWGNELSKREKLFGSYSFGEMTGALPLDESNQDLSDNPNTVKVSLNGHSTLPLSVAIHYSVLCERTSAKFQQWQIDTYNAILTAYNALKLEYQDALQNQEFELVINIQGRNPLINREVEKNELKKHAISLLTGQQYESFNAMEEDHHLGYPQINLLDATEEGLFVRFFEQALEWRNMTYLFYSYFWGKKGDWVKNLSITDNDPLFEQFLKAGYSRVWVPVRPGFEEVIGHYIKCGGEPWDEKVAPLCGEGNGSSAPIVSLIEEIKEQLGNDFETREGTLTVVQNDKTIQGNDTNFTKDDIDREILIALESYRIADVDESNQAIELRNPYIGVDASEVSYAVGVKYVGEPWVVQVPTTLVYLENDSKIIES